MTTSSVKTPKLPQRTRTTKANLPPFRLTARDRAVIRAVYAYRALTTQQISDLLFPSTAKTSADAISSRCLHRLKVLFHAGFLVRSEQPQLLSEGRKPFVYHLDQRGAELIALLDACEVGDLDWRLGEYVGHLYLDHLLMTNAIRIAIVRAAQKHGFTIEKWLDEKTLKSVQMKDTVTLSGERGQKQAAAVVPDGYFHLYTDTHHYHQFLETDLRTVTGDSNTWGRRTWARKAMTFIEYYRSGKYHERYHTKSMRILCVTTGEKRLAHLKEITEKVGGKSRFWFTTFDKVTPEAVLTAPIWQQAGKDGLYSLTW